MIEDAKAPRIDLIVLPKGAVPYEAFHCVYPFFEVQRIWTKHFGSGAQQEFPANGRLMEKPISVLKQYEGHTYWEVCNAFWVQALANHYQCEVIVGMDDRDLESGKHFNAAFHFSPNGSQRVADGKTNSGSCRRICSFQKLALVFELCLRAVRHRRFVRARTGSQGFAGRIPMGVSICYEETYSEMIRHLRKKDAQMFVNISNDVWFPRSRLARQHFDHGMVRAVENGLPLIRACNTGITGGVDCFGQHSGAPSRKSGRRSIFRSSAPHISDSLFQVGATGPFLL